MKRINFERIEIFVILIRRDVPLRTTRRILPISFINLAGE
mgnify:CR=1 FL=1